MSDLLGMEPGWCMTCAESHDPITWNSLGMVCGRCHQHTGNNHQGHYWGFCKVTKTTREMHFCCPGDCQLEKKEG